MISINVGGIAQDHLPLPVFRSMLMLKLGGLFSQYRQRKQGGTLSVLRSGMIEMQISCLPELQPHASENQLQFDRQ